MCDIGVGHFHNRLWYICGLGFAAGAIEVVVSGFLIPELRANWHMTEYELGTIPMATGFGSVVGMLFWGSVADNYGRKTVFVITSVIVAVFGLASAAAPSLMALIWLRAIVAFGYGGSIAVDFTLFTEFLPTNERANRLFQLQAFWPLGQFATCLIARLVIPSVGWRGFLAVCAIPAFLTSMMRPWMPESPRWLLLQGRHEEAVATLRSVAATNGQAYEDVGLREGVHLTLDNASTSIQPQHAKDSSPVIVRMFGPPHFCTTLGLIFFGVALHVAGYGTSTFMPSLLEMKGVQSIEMYDMMIWSSVAQMPGVIGALILSNYLGRMLMMKSSFIFVAAAFLCLSAARNKTEMLVCMCFSSMACEVCWALYHTYIPEVFPTSLRATVSGILPATASLFSGWIPFAAAYCLEQFQTSGVCIFFAGACAAGSVAAVLFLHVETCDRDLRDA